MALIHAAPLPIKLKGVLLQSDAIHRRLFRHLSVEMMEATDPIHLTSDSSVLSINMLNIGIEHALSLFGG